MVKVGGRFWPRMFLAAALFNFVFGVPMWLASDWSYGLAYLPPATGALALGFWSDYGFAVVLIGVGYYLVSRDPAGNHSLIWIGICAKLFDIATLGLRFGSGVARPAVLFPALVDSVFVVLFALYLYRASRSARTGSGVSGLRA